MELHSSAMAPPTIISTMQQRPIRWGAMAQAAFMGFGTGGMVGAIASFAHSGRPNPQAAAFLGFVLGVGSAFKAA